MAVYVMKINGTVVPNNTATWTAIERAKNGDGLVGIDSKGFISFASGLILAVDSFAYHYRGMGLIDYPTLDNWFPIGNVFAAREISQDGAGDYIYPLQFMPIPDHVKSYNRILSLQRAANVRTTSPFNEQYSKPSEAVWDKLRFANPNEVFNYYIGEQSHIAPTVPANAPLVPGNIPPAGITGFQYDTGMNILGIDKYISHVFYRAYTGINTNVINPITQADIAASITP